ncbi:MAG: glutathione-disulfide reductase [Pseudomonadota bacterium]
MSNQFDLIVIGGGSGGLAHAQRAAEYGARVMVVESGRLGGTCVNVGCVPKKVMWYAASMAHDIDLATSYGFAVQAPTHDWRALQQSRDAYVARLNGIYARNLDNKAITVVRGRARFIDAHSIDVDGMAYTGHHITIATGGYPKVPDLPGAEHGITSDGFFELDAQPKRVAVVGSGYVAVEFAGVLAALGSETTLMTRFDGVLRSFDSMLRESVSDALRADGVDLFEHVMPAGIDEELGALTLRAKDGRVFGPFDSVVWAVGRAPATDGLGTAAAGIDIDADGFIPVDEWQATNVANVFALGDVTGAVALTPVAIAAGRRLADRLFGGMHDRRLEYRDIATVIFSHPPSATMGLTEAQAREMYGDDEINVFTSRFVPMRYALGDTKRPAAMKLITAGEEQHIVGCHIFGDGADEMMQGFAVAIRMGARKQDFDDTVAIHPTSAEELVTMR